jgi:hypothetical protein
MNKSKYVVKQDNDGIGYYVEKQICNIGYTVHGVSLNKTEMIDLANKLNEDEYMLEVEQAYQTSKTSGQNK